MRKTMAFGLAFAMATLVFAAFPMNVSAVGEVSYYAFDEGSGNITYDSWGTNDGIIYGATWTSGVIGSALDFNGAGDFVEIPDDPSLDLADALTIKAWIKPVQPTMGYVVCKEQLPGYPQSGSAYTLDIFPGKVRSVLWQAGSPPPTAPAAVGATNILPDVWQHVAVTWDGSIVKVFYNGVVDGTGNFTGPLLLSDAPVAIGQYGGVFFHGVIDEVEIYNVALPDEEIMANYLAGINPVYNVDIDPDTLNLKSKGNWITCYIELKAGYDANDIDVSTVAITDINGVPVNIPAESHPTGVGDEDGDGVPDLMVKFDRSDVQDACSPGPTTITISGNLLDGTALSGSDTITVIDPP
jgi:hypothetical protein